MPVVTITFVTVPFAGDEILIVPVYELSIVTVVGDNPPLNDGDVPLLTVILNDCNVLPAEFIANSVKFDVPNNDKFVGEPEMFAVVPDQDNVAQGGSDPLATATFINDADEVIEIF